MFKWGLSQDFVNVDPTKGLPTFDQGQARDRVLTPDEIRLLWPWLENLPSAVADVLRAQLSTGAPVGEIAGMTVGEVDRDKWLWTLPAERSKNKKPRITPLVGVARTIVEARLEAAGEGALFLSETGAVLTSAAVGNALLTRRARLPIAMFRSHDLRRTAVSLMFEIGVARDTIAAVIGHSEADDKGARTLLKHYRKTDLIALKTRALTAYDAYLQAIVAGEDAVDNVVSMRSGAQ